MGQKNSNQNFNSSQCHTEETVAQQNPHIVTANEYQHSINTSPQIPVQSFAKPWSVVVKSNVDEWKDISKSYGFQEITYGCANKECDRDSICLRRARVVIHKSSKEIEIQRYNTPLTTISYKNNQELCQKIALGYNINEVVGAEKKELMLLVMFRWERLQNESAFILVDHSKRKILSMFESPATNMSIMECSISPDGQKVAILYYHRPDSTLPFLYNLYLIDAQSGSVIDVITCNTEVRPYIVFDPRYKYSRVVIVNYSNNNDGFKNNLVSYCVSSKNVVTVSQVMLSIIYGSSYFCVTFSRDGRFFILQKITVYRNGCCADMYIFDADKLKLLKHYYINLKQHSLLCNSNYTPAFSLCGSRMCILSEENLENNKLLFISVHQLPRPISLREQCRISILQTMRSLNDVDVLPLPTRLRAFLSFIPEY